MLNVITVMGRLTRDPELRRTGSGVAVASFALAVETDYKDKDGNRKTIFLDCVAWRGTGEFASKYFSKGRMAVVKGSLDIRDWTDKEGIKRKTPEIVVESMYFADSKRDSDTGSSYGGNSYAEPSYPAPAYVQNTGEFEQIDDDDAQLPF